MTRLLFVKDQKSSMTNKPDKAYPLLSMQTFKAMQGDGFRQPIDHRKSSRARSENVGQKAKSSSSLAARAGENAITHPELNLGTFSANDTS